MPVLPPFCFRRGAGTETWHASGVFGNKRVMRLNRQRSGDAELIIRSCREPALFESIFAHHFLAVYRYLRRRVGDASAEELAAETFLQAFASRERYRPHSSRSALPWLFGIATNLMLEQARRQERRSRAYARAAVASERAEDGDRAIDRLIANEDARRIAAAISALPEAQREVLLLHAWAELTSEEIGTALAIPAATARSRLSRARAAVTATLLESVTTTDAGEEET
jgi:RNA polymerase sigma factor (sigma-70 family)